jgi:transposase-like protein
MMLMVACGIDANDHVVPLAWALVPTENEVWWRWFCTYLKAAFQGIGSFKSCVLISDRDKGIASAIKEVFPIATPAYCCQHIADNIQSKFGVKFREPFWKMARAKTRKQFREILEEVQVENGAVALYIEDIPYDLWAQYIYICYSYIFLC